MRKERRSYMHRNSVIHAKPGSNNGAFLCIFFIQKGEEKCTPNSSPPWELPTLYTRIISTKVNCKMRWIADRWHGLISILNQVPYTEHRIMNFNCFLVPRSNSHFHPIVQRRFDCKTHGTHFYKLDGHKKRQLISQNFFGKEQFIYSQAYKFDILNKNPQ